MTDFMSAHIDGIQQAFANANFADAHRKAERTEPMILSAGRLKSFSEISQLGQAAQAANDSLLPETAGHYLSKFLCVDDVADVDARDVLAAAAHGDRLAECIAAKSVKERLVYQFLGRQGWSRIESTEEHDTSSARWEVVKNYQDYASDRDRVDDISDVDETIATIENLIQPFTEIPSTVRGMATEALENGRMPLDLYIQFVTLTNSGQSKFAAAVLDEWSSLEPAGVYTAPTSS